MTTLLKNHRITILPSEFAGLRWSSLARNGRIRKCNVRNSFPLWTLASKKAPSLVVNYPFYQRKRERNFCIWTHLDFLTYVLSTWAAAYLEIRENNIVTSAKLFTFVYFTEQSYCLCKSESGMHNNVWKEISTCQQELQIDQVRENAGWLHISGFIKNFLHFEATTEEFMKDSVGTILRMGKFQDYVNGIFRSMGVMRCSKMRG